MSTPDEQYEQLLRAAEDAATPELLEQLHARYIELLRGGTTVSGLPYPYPTDPLSEGADAIRALAEAIEAGLPASIIVSGRFPIERMPERVESATGQVEDATAGGDQAGNGGKIARFNAFGQIGVATPTSRTQTANKGYVDDQIGERAAPVQHTHPASDVTSGTFAAARIPKVMNLNGVSYGTAAPSGGADGDIYFRLV